MSYASYAWETFANMLGAIDGIVAKAQQAGTADDVLGAKLTEDMFPLELQFRVALNQVILGLGQVGGQQLPAEETEYQSLAEVRERIAAVRAYLDGADPVGWAEAERPVDLTLPNGVRFLMTSEEDIRDWIMPNFYFHVTMAYALLRAAGVELGKMDFLPHMAGHIVPPPNRDRSAAGGALELHSRSVKRQLPTTSRRSTVRGCASGSDMSRRSNAVKPAVPQLRPLRIAL